MVSLALSTGMEYKIHSQQFFSPFIVVGFVINQHLKVKGLAVGAAVLCLTHCDFDVLEKASPSLLFIGRE